MHVKKILRKVSRIIGWTLLVVVVLLTSVILLVRIPAIQNRIAQKAIAYLEDKIKTNVDLKSITITFPKKIVIEGLYLEDQNRDTLLYAGRLAVDASMWELLHNKILLNKIELSNTTGNISRTLPDSAFNFDYIVNAFASSDSIQEPADTTASPWTFSIGDVELDRVKVKYDDRTTKMLVKADIGELDLDTDNMDFDALKFQFDDIVIANANLTYATDSAQYQVTDLKLDASDILYDSTVTEANVNSLTLHEKTFNVDVKKLEGFARLKGNEIELKTLELLANNSAINLTGKIDYQKLAGEISISESKIALADILQFQPDLLDSLPVNIPKETVVSIDADIKGDTTRAEISKLELRTLDSTYVSLNGLYSKDKLDIVLKQFVTSGRDIKTVFSDTLLPVTPRFVKLEGKVNGTTKKPVIASKLSTDLGIVTANGSVELTEVPSYKAKILARNIKAGVLAKQDSLGDINFDLAIDGRGFTTKDLHTKVDLLVHDIIYNSYRFENFTVNGTIDKFLFSGKAALNDENLAFDLTADLDYNGNVPVYNATLDLRNLDMRELKLTDRPLKMRLAMDVKLATSDFQVMNGNLDIRKVAVFNGEKMYAVDSLLFASLDQERHSKMSIRSDILSGDFEGSFNIFSVGEVLSNHFARYFSNGVKRTQPEGPPQNFSFSLAIKNTELITEVLVPELEPFTPGVIKGDFDSREHRLNFAFRMPRLEYDNIQVDSFVFWVKSDVERLRYFSKVENLEIDSIKVDQVNFRGHIAHDSIRAVMNVLDSAKERKYRIGTRIAKNESLMRIHLDDSLMLNYSKWAVPTDNYLEIGDGVLAANHVEIEKNKQKVIMLGDTRKDPALTIQFEELELGNFTHLVAGVVPASGELNGDFKFNTSGGGDFSSKLTIDGLTILQKPLGDLSFALNHTQNNYDVLLGLRGNRTKLEAKGTYGGEPGLEILDMLVDINQLNMEVVQAFSMGQLSSAEGILKGKIAVKGKPTHPDIAGDLTFSDVSVAPTYLGSTFVMKNETIAIRNDNITLNNFTIADDSGNKAVLKGNINIKTYTNPEFDLTLTTKGFQVLNTKEGDNDLFYGKVRLNSSARITGSASAPKASVKLGFTEDTNFTYVVPTSEKGVLEAKGIVTFVDKDAAKDPFLNSLDASDSIQSTFAGIEVSAVIDLTDKEILNIVIDPITGDKLTVQGNSSLTLDMTASGNMTLSGRYEITKGSYNLSFYNLVKRKFDITKGSTITWSGDPLNAQMDIRASNLVETSPLDLLAQQAGAANAANFNQRLPFLVYLKIKGLLLSPQISFELDMPADKRNAFGGMLYAKLLDINSRESDLNKQVFALIILKRFVSDNPLESNTGSTNAARTSVSRILSDQLNKLTSNVKGVQLTFDIKSYEDATVQGGTQGTTKAQLGVQKSLFGDRLVVKLAGNVDIEGQNAGSNSVTDYIGDLALEYKMTADGRFRVTGFRNSNYDMIDGELTETGAGLIYIKDYNTLRELFKANEKQTP